MDHRHVDVEQDRVHFGAHRALLVCGVVMVVSTALASAAFIVALNYTTVARVLFLQAAGIGTLYTRLGENLESLAEALDRAPQTPLRQLQVLRIEPQQHRRV